MDTKKFRTKTEFLPTRNEKVDGAFVIAVDLGYSAVKLFSPNWIARFPNYARRVDDEFQFISAPPEETILYKDLDTNEVWIVGKVAQDLIKAGDTTDSESSLYGRERYYNPMFLVTARAALGIGLMENEYGKISNNDRLIIQTGLPERYMSDKEDLIDVLATTHHFAIKLAKSDWIEFNFYVDEKDIDVMSQPKGALFSVITNENGKFTADAKDFLASDVLVFDPGFGTLDLFSIRAGGVVEKDAGATYDDLGMKRVFQETAKAIKNDYHVDLEVAAMQKNMETGLVRYSRRKGLDFVTKDYSFDEQLRNASIKVCNEALERVANTVNLTNYKYMIVTGGTGACWFNEIHNRLKNLSTLTIVSANRNDKLPFVYANVRGYYHNRLMTIRAAS